MKDPWLTNELLELIVDKDRLLETAKSTNNPNDWITARQAKNRLKNLTKRAKSIYFCNLLDEHKNNTKFFWKTVTQKLQGKDKTRKDITLINQDTEVTVTESDTPNFVNNYFPSIGPSLAEKFDDNWEYHGLRYNNNFNLTRTTVQEVTQLVKEINIAKSSSVNNASSRVLKEAWMVLSHQLTHIFNLSINSGIFPDSWKKSIINPVPKEGDPTDINNYRPVTHLPLPGKLLERIIHRQVYGFLEKYNIINEHGGGG